MSQIQVQFKGQIKHFALDPVELNNLQSQIRIIFSIPSQTPLKLRFLDEEKDLITISLSEELEEALSSCKPPLVIFVEAEGLNSDDSFVLIDQVSTATKKQEIKEAAITQQPKLQQEIKEEEEEDKEENSKNEGKKIIQEGDKDEDEPMTEEMKDVEVFHPNTLDYIANEFHYHRLIVQTAVQSTFNKIREKPIVNETIQSIKQQKEIIVEAISATLREWRNGMRQNSPSPHEIADKVSHVLKEAGMMASPIVEKIRQSIVNILNSILEHKDPLAITHEEVEQMSEIAAQAGNIEMENLLMCLDKSDSKINLDNQEYQVPSTLEEEDGFVCVENYHTEDPNAARNQKKADQNSEVIWEISDLEKRLKESSQEEIKKSKNDINSSQFNFQKEYDALLDMGFISDESKVKSLLTQFNGDIDQVVNSLL